MPIIVSVPMSVSDMRFELIWLSVNASYLQFYVMSLPCRAFVAFISRIFVRVDGIKVLYLQHNIESKTCNENNDTQPETRTAAPCRPPRLMWRQG